jgi:hypothetical protein
MGQPIIIHFYNNPFTILLHSFRTVFYNLFTQAFTDPTSTPHRGGGGVFIFLSAGYIIPLQSFRFFSLIRLKVQAYGL